MLGLALFTSSSLATLAASRLRCPLVRAVATAAVPLRDNGPNQEFSVVYTSRALNHMSPPFKSVMKSLSSTLTAAYSADCLAIVPGSGTSAMEAVARQFVPLSGGGRPVVVRNGWFSFRWSEIFGAMGRGDADHVVLKARPSPNPGLCTLQYEPANIADVVKAIEKERVSV